VAGLAAAEAGVPFAAAGAPLGQEGGAAVAHAALAVIATTLMRYANDGHILLALDDGENNAEEVAHHFDALKMACAQVLGNNGVVSAAAARGRGEAGAFRPVVAAALVASARLLGDAAAALARHYLGDDGPLRIPTITSASGNQQNKEPEGPLTAAGDLPVKEMARTTKNASSNDAGGAAAAAPGPRGKLHDQLHHLQQQHLSFDKGTPTLVHSHQP